MNRWLLVGGVLLAVALGITGMFLAVTVMEAARTIGQAASGDKATWFAGIGGICAIFGAFRIGNSQIVAARRVEADKLRVADFRRLDGITALVGAAMGNADAMRDAILNGRIELFVMERAFLPASIKMVRGIPLYDLGNFELVSVLSQFPEALDRMFVTAGHIADEVKFKVPVAHSHYRELEYWYQRSEKYLDDIKRLCDGHHRFARTI